MESPTLKYRLIFALTLFFQAHCIGQFQFTDITKEAGIDYHYLSVDYIGGGAAFFDMDNDGDEDLWISGGIERDVLYENDGTGNFSEIGLDAGLAITNDIFTTGVITGDLDNDGFKDVMIITHKGFPNMLMRNMGNNTFISIGDFSGITFEAYSVAAAFGDVNNDGLLDIYEGHYVEDAELIYDGIVLVGFDHKCYTNKLYINNGDWKFTDVSEEIGVDDNGCTLAVMMTDYDDDNDIDILGVNDFGEWVVPNQVYENQNQGEAFIEVGEATGMNSGIYGMGIASGDFDNDMDIDYYITNIGQNVLLQNDGDGNFSDIAVTAGVHDTYAQDSLFTVGWGTAFMDLDNDTDLDLFVTNGHIPAGLLVDNGMEIENSLYSNQGDGSFLKVVGDSIIESKHIGRGLAYADIDLDGDLDFLVVNINNQNASTERHPVQLIRNDNESGHNWLEIGLEGKISNRDGCGSRIELYSGGESFLSKADGGYGTHASQNSKIVHFGLGTIQSIDSILVKWPSGQTTKLENIEINQVLTIVESEISSNVTDDVLIDKLELKISPNPFQGETLIEYHLDEKSNLQVIITDQVGKVILSKKEKNKPEGIHEFIWQAPIQGIYFISIITDQGKTYKTLISN